MVLKGYRNFTDGLWDVRFPNKTQTIQYLKQKTIPSMNHHINAIIRKNTSKSELAQYLHASCGSPAITIFLNAIKKGNFITWPGIENM